MGKLLPSGSSDSMGHGLDRHGGKVSKQIGAQAGPSRRAEVQGLLGAFSRVSVREQTDAKDVTGGNSEGLVMGQMWGEGEGGATDRNSIGGEAEWMEKEKASSNVSYLGHLCSGKAQNRLSQPQHYGANSLLWGPSCAL